jgi:hypothetical protein
MSSMERSLPASQATAACLFVSFRKLDVCLRTRRRDLGYDAIAELLQSSLFAIHAFATLRFRTPRLQVMVLDWAKTGATARPRGIFGVTDLAGNGLRAQLLAEARE